MKQFYAIIISIILSSIGHAAGQTFSKGLQLSILPSQVIYGNYTTIQLITETDAGASMNRFDKNNPYTYIQLISDNNGQDYHILYQTNFFGKISLLAYSNNLAFLFVGKDKPFNVFMNCIHHINEPVSAIENINIAVNCILARLEYCKN